MIQQSDMKISHSISIYGLLIPDTYNGSQQILQFFSSILDMRLISVHLKLVLCFFCNLKALTSWKGNLGCNWNDSNYSSIFLCFSHYLKVPGFGVSAFIVFSLFIFSMFPENMGRCPLDQLSGKILLISHSSKKIFLCSHDMRNASVISKEYRRVLLICSQLSFHKPDRCSSLHHCSCFFQKWIWVWLIGLGYIQLNKALHPPDFLIEIKEFAPNLLWTPAVLDEDERMTNW